MKRIVAELKQLSEAGRVESSLKFLQAQPGGYGEGDQFLGVTVPNIRSVAKKFLDLEADDLDAAMISPWHECRLTALIILEHQFRRATVEKKPDLVRFFLERLDYVNNWDLVDTAAPKILGVYLLKNPKERKVLDELASSGQLWRERVSVVATMPLIKHGEFAEILKLSKRFLNHPHDLMHKATGWMLRDVGQQDVEVLFQFLDANASKMPRTMLRYAIEHQTAEVRKHYMSLPRG